MTNEQKYKTAEERVKAFKSQHCERYDDCAQCQYNPSCGGIDGRSIGLYIMAHWLALEAEEEKPEPCPFCGKIPFVNEGRNGYGDMLYYIVCECGYSTKENFRNKEYAIAAWNRRAGKEER